MAVLSFGGVEHFPNMLLLAGFLLVSHPPIVNKVVLGVDLGPAPVFFLLSCFLEIILLPSESRVFHSSWYDDFSLALTIATPPG
jgi:hypothetical protein